MLRIAAFVAVIGLVWSAAVQTDPTTCLSWTDCDATCDGGERQCDRSNGNTWILPCHVQDCTPAVAGCGNADIVFVVDSSASIGEKNWFKTKQFVIDVTKGLTIGPQDSRVAMVVYSNEGNTQWGLEEYSTNADLEEHIWELEWLAGNTNTYDGLVRAEEVIDQSGRQYLKHIVVVITDGKSNMKAKKCVPQAEAMHAKGVEIFCVGVTDDIDYEEVVGIASEPKDLHSHNITNYDALVDITNTIIGDVCEAAKLVECSDWSDWSDCRILDQTKKCGLGVSSRIRTCYIKLTAADQGEIRIHTETRPCDEVCDRCARCTYSNGQGYAPADNCRQFIQCEYNNGGFIEHLMNCPAVLSWNQDRLTCDNINACADAPVVAPEETTPAFVCDKTAVAGEPGKYVWNLPTYDVTMPCAPGTVFSVRSCQCVIGAGNAPTVCNRDTLLEFPFNTDTNDICNRAAGTPLGNVTLSDGAAYFDGQSRVQVGYLNNWFVDNPTTQMTVSLWFRYTGDGDSFRGLFSNGDCKERSSLSLAMGDNVAKGQVLTETAEAVFDNIGTRLIVADEWTLLTLVYTGWDVKFYINGGQVASEASISGPIANTQCDTQIGFSGRDDKEHYFEGFIDDVRVYTKMLWDYDITQLYTNGRQ